MQVNTGFTVGNGQDSFGSNMDTLNAVHTIGHIGQLSTTQLTNVTQPFRMGNTVESVQLTEDGNIEVVRRIPSNAILTVMPSIPAPDSLIKEIYGVLDGKIVLIETKQGTVKPAQYIAETYEWQ